MSPRSNPSSKKSKEQHRPAIDRPFDPAVLATAHEIAERYSVVLEPRESGGFFASALEFPTAFAFGRTAEECVTETRKVLMIGVATLLESGRKPPAPAVEGNRDAQMNVRLTAEEKLLLERSARQSGFRGVSDFVRHAALNRAMGLDLPAVAPVPGRSKRKSQTPRRRRRARAAVQK